MPDIVWPTGGEHKTTMFDNVENNKINPEKRDIMNNNLQQKMDELFKAGNYEETYNFCVTEIKRLAEHVGELNDEERKYMAALYSTVAKMSEPEDALKCMDCAVKLVGNEAAYYIQRAKIKEQLSDWQGAFNDYSVVINHAPNFEAYGYRGFVHLNFQNYEDAMEDLTKSVELNPNYGDGYIHRGYAKFNLGDIEGAVKDYDTAIELYPDYAYGYGFRGDAKIKLNDLKGALADFKKVMELDPEDIRAKKAFVDIKMHLADGKGIETMDFTKKDGTQVRQFITDEGIVELPLEE